MPTLITADNLAANTITPEKIASTVALGGPRIANVQIANSSWSQLDDTAVDTAGGYVIVNGSGFNSGCQVLINSTPATSVTFVSSSVLRVQVPAKDANTYVMYVVNPDGGTAVGVNALTYSGSPVWITSSTLSNQVVNTAISIQLSATGANTYSLQAGSSVPANTTLSSNGLFSGTITGIVSNTTYSFTVVATDNENQDSPRTFSVTVSVMTEEPYWADTVLLLNGNGANNSTSIIDSSSYNFTMTRSIALLRNDQKKYGSASIYMDTTGYIATPTNSAFSFSNNNFTIETWYNPTRQERQGIFYGMWGEYQGGNSSEGGWVLDYDSGNLSLAVSSMATGAYWQSVVSSLSNGTWYHIALVRSGSNIKLFKNGISVINANLTSNSTKFGNVGELYFGSWSPPETRFYTQAYYDDIRVTKGIARYTTNFTPPGAELGQYVV